MFKRPLSSYVQRRPPRDGDAARNRLDDEHLELFLALFLRADANCVDVGANKGGILKHISRLAPSGRHLAFEPLPDLAAGLTSQYPDVDVRAVALSNQTGVVPFHHVVTRSTRSGFLPFGQTDDEQEVIEVRTQPMDEALPADYRPAFIKIDVEGAELQVLQGSLRTIATHKPAVAFEHSVRLAPHFGTGPADIYSLLVGEAGLRIFDMDGGGPYDEAMLTDVFDRHARWNFIAHA